MAEKTNLNTNDSAAVTWLDRAYAVMLLIQDKFKSGNEIPVERITITRAEVDAISKRILS